MRQLSPSGQQAVDDIASRHGFSRDAVASMLESVVGGNGGMAQFNHPEFGGYGQWMRGGMTMVSDMFNNHLKGRVDGLCMELASLVANQPGLVQGGSFQSQSQGGQPPMSSYRDAGSSGGSDGAGLFVAGPGGGDWWPGDLRHPNSTGAQNGARYAYFAQARRLAIELGGNVTVYDTLDHQIGGVSQQQSGSGSIAFTSQHGLIDIATLPVVSGSNSPHRQPAPLSQELHRQEYPSADTSAGAENDVFSALEKLAGLRDKGILSEAEFSSKKAELLARL